MKVPIRGGSGWRKFKHVVEDADRHGNVRVYFRRKGQPKIRLNEVPGTPAFDQEYQRAFRGELVTAPASTTRRTFAMPGSMQWLCEQYYSSAAFQALGASTRKVRRGILDGMNERI